MQSHVDKQTALMYLAKQSKLNLEMFRVAQKILQSPLCNINIRDKEGNTALHVAINSNNIELFREILFNSHATPDLSIRNAKEQTILWLALMQTRNEDKLDETNDASFANLLISKGCEINTIDSNGDSILHLCARANLESAALFLVNKGAKINILNHEVTGFFLLLESEKQKVS